jgi:cysteine-S-conjugate beta-lyase
LSDSFNFEIDRTGTSSTKYDGRQAMFGHAGVMPLWVADMDFAAPAAVTEALISRAAHPIYGYTLIPDSLYTSLIDWLKRRHDWQVEREWIILCPGVVPSLNIAIMALTKLDDPVIIQPPVYYPFFSAVTKTGRKLSANPLRLEQERYSMDMGNLAEQAATARMLLFCSPHNPVGRVWSKPELKELLDIAKRYELIIASDEIHADLVYPETKHHILSKLTDCPDQIITAVAPSKTFNIPGLNLSALIVPNAKYRTAITKYLEMMHVSVANPFSVVAFETAYRQGGAWLDSLMAYLASSRGTIQRYLTEHLPEIRVITPEGTYLVWLDCRALGMSDEELGNFFISEAGIGMSPGILFGKEGSGFMRMNIGAPRHQIKLALENIRDAINRKNNPRFIG